MIVHLKGRVEAVDSPAAVIDVNGVGYEVLCSGKTLSALPNLGEAVYLFTVHIEREDGSTLYGFATQAERALFRTLMTVQGVGGKVALAILSALTPSELQTAILSGDKTMLTRADGVGPKLALRLVTELKDKVLGAAGPMEISGAKKTAAPESSLANDALSALQNLGYPRGDAYLAIQKAIASGHEKLDDLIKAALKELMAK